MSRVMRSIVPEVNDVFLAGRLARDPALRYTQAGIPVLDARMVCTRTAPNGAGELEQEQTFLGLVAKGADAERIFETCRKGTPMMVRGRLQSGEWTTTEGEKRSTLEVRVTRYQVLEREEDPEELEDADA